MHLLQQMLPAAMPCGYARHPVLLYLLSLHCTRQRRQVHNGMVLLLFKGTFVAAAAAAAATAACHYLVMAAVTHPVNARCAACS